jgi:hypothetical protein
MTAMKIGLIIGFTLFFPAVSYPQDEVMISEARNKRYQANGDPQKKKDAEN